MTPLRIAVDARELAGHVTGAGVYLLNMLRHWLPREDVRLSLIAHRDLAPDVTSTPGLDRASVVVEPARVGGTRWEQLVLPRAAAATRSDVLLSPAYTAPLMISIPTVLALHDVSFAAHPEWYAQPGRFRRNFIARRAARRAAAVVTLSEFSAGEIARHYGIARGAMRVIPPGAPPRVPASPAVAREPLVTYVGSIFNRRHVPALIAAFTRVARGRPDARLFIAGADRTWPRQDIRGLVDASGVADRITWRTDASNAAVSDALARASVSVFLSEYEGFAMTPFEALAHGVPSVLLDTPVAREVYGDAAVLVDRADPDTVAAAVQRLLDDPALREDVVARGAPLWARYDWARSADDLLRVVREAAR